MAVVNTYYDFDDYNSPVKTYFDDQFYYDFVAGYEKETDVYVRQESVEQKDSFFRYSPKGDESNFITIEKVKEKFKSENSDTKVVMSVRFYKDPTSRSYERQVFALLDVFGNIGGVNEILEITGGLIVALFSGKIFLFSLLSSMYQVDSTHINQIDKKIVDDPKTVLASESNKKYPHLDNDMKIENIEIIEEKKYRKEVCLNNNDQINQNAVDHSDLNNEIVQKAAENMRKRYRYSYSVFDLAYNFLMPIKIFFC